MLPPQQISFGYISSAREEFVPEAKPDVRVTVKSKKAIPLPKSVPLSKILTKKDPVPKKPSVASVLPAISPKQRSRKVSAEYISSSIETIAALTDIDAESEPLLLGESVESETDLMPVLTGFPRKAFSQDEHTGNMRRELTGKKDNVSSGFQAALPRYDLNPKPVYPEVARRRGWEGTVLFEVLVLENGHVGALEMTQSSGYRSLDRAARKAIRGWVFKAATSFGVTVTSRVVVPVDFVLDQN